jgi:hypothetical protein
MENLDESLLAAEGAVNAEQNRPGNHNTHCLNCGTKLQDVFCHHCGQKDLPRRQTMWELWENVISSFFSYEGKFFLTVRYLVSRPGFLAMEFNAGRRERYFHPVRMYAFISFIFFLIFFSLPEKKNAVELTEEDKQELADNERKVKESLAASGLDTLQAADTLVQDTTHIKPKRKNRFNYGLNKADYASVGQYDSAQALLPEAERDGWFSRKMTIRSIELNQNYGNNPSGFGNDFWKASLENFSKVLFFLLPVFALLLKLLYSRRDYFYSEHLVFSMYYYNFFYFAGSIMMLVGLVPALGWLTTFIGWAIYIYLLLAMKRMYGQGWGKTITKFLIFSFVYMLCFFFGFLINLFVIVMIL